MIYNDGNVSQVNHVRWCTWYVVASKRAWKLLLKKVRIKEEDN